MQKTSGLETFLVCAEDGGRRVVCPIAERRHRDYVDIVTPYGFGGFAGDKEVSSFASAWRVFAESRGYVCGYIALNPVFERTSYYDEADAYSDNSLYFLDLTRSDEDLLRSMDRNRRRQLRSWPDTRSRMITDRSRLVDFLVDKHPEFLRRVQGPAAAELSRETLTFLCQQENVLVVGAGEADRIQAVYVFAFTPHLGDCFRNVAVPEGRRHATALLWWGVQELRARGAPRLNLGGGNRENDTIAQAKQRFGAERIPFRALKQIYRPDVYARLCRSAGTDPADRQGYFPGYRSPRPRPADLA